jgi:hypothetical protein
MVLSSSFMVSSATLHRYVFSDYLVSHRKPEIELWEAAAEGPWRSRSFGPGQTVDVQLLPVRLVVDEIYAAAREPGA